MRMGRWTPVVLWAAVILVITSVPDVPAPSTPGSDKVGHFILYFVFGLLAIRAASATALTARSVAGTVAALALFAAIDEWHQRFIPTRSAEFDDWIADICGAALGDALFSLFRLRRPAAA